MKVIMNLPQKCRMILVMENLRSNMRSEVEKQSYREFEQRKTVSSNLKNYFL